MRGRITLCFASLSIALAAGVALAEEEAPTAYDQLMLEIINRARANPAAEAQQLGISLNEGLPDNTIDPDPKQPLAFNPQLLAAAHNHSKWMLQTGVFSHTGLDGSTSEKRIAMAGYKNQPPRWGSAENISQMGMSSPEEVALIPQRMHRQLFLDSETPGRSHRLNLMNADFREAGIGIEQGRFGGFDSLLLTEDFAYSGQNVYLTGVAYRDQVKQDNFYSLDEGVGNVEVRAVRQDDKKTFTTRTWPSGGYSLALPSGVYDVTFTAGTASRIFNNVEVGRENVKLDFVVAPELSPGRATRLYGPPNSFPQ